MKLPVCECGKEYVANDDCKSIRCKCGRIMYFKKIIPVIIHEQFEPDAKDIVDRFLKKREKT